MKTATSKVTSIEELKAASQGTLVELPPFAEGTHFIARLKRPSMLGLVKAKRIPNELLMSANTLFQKGTTEMNVEDTNLLDDLFGVMEVICEDAFVEPSYAELKEAGISLTDEQMLAIFSYSQNGISALSSFRE